MSVSSMIRNNAVTVSIMTRSTGVDAVGSRTDTYNATVTSALVQVTDGSQAIEGGGERQAAKATFYFEAGASITIADRVRVGSRDFNVTSVRVPDEKPTTDPLSYVIVDATEAFG